MKTVRATTIKPFVWLGGSATYLLLTVTIANGSIGFFVPSTAKSQYGPSKCTFGSHFVVILWSGQCCDASIQRVLQGFQEDGWSCDYQSLHLCDEVANQRRSMDDVVVTPLPKGFIKEALCIINADRSVRVPGTILENVWEKEVTCWKLGESPPALASNPESPPPSTSPLLFDEEDTLSEPENNIAAFSSEPTVGESRGRAPRWEVSEGQC